MSKRRRSRNSLPTKRKQSSQIPSPVSLSQQPVCHLDSFIIPWGGPIQGQDHLGIVVPDSTQGLHLPLEGLLGRHVRCHLEIGEGALSLRHEVHLIAAHLADIHLIATAQQLKIHHVFQREARS